MNQTPLTILKLSLCNLRRRPFRTACLIIIVAILAFTLFGGSILILSLQNGMRSMEQRLGANLMVVPKGYEADIEGVLLKGEPNYFYFNNSNITTKIAHIEGVSQMTSQFFLTSLSAPCCSALVQLIGFDPGTDFVIQPWITKTHRNAIGDGQLVAGSDIVLENNHTLKFFNHSYPVAAQLERTATGLDSSVFMNMNTMKSLIAAAHEAGMNFISDMQPESAVSSILIKTDKGYDAEKVAKKIRKAVSDADVIVSKKMITGISDNLGSLGAYIHTLTAVLWILTVLILAVVFSVTVHERKREFAVFRVLGATRKKLVGIVLTESFFKSAAGGVIGVAAASVVVFPFSVYIGDRLQLPYLEPKAGVILGVFTLSLLLSLAVGPLASVYSAIKISRVETYLSMREGE
jgi:putative ABC transport system permease protein